MNKSDTYCVMTHAAMALQNEGDYCCCNVNKESWKDNKHQVIHVYSHPLKTAFKSYTRKLIATALDRGIKHPSCQVCWDLEETAGTSSRQMFNQAFGHIEPLSTQPCVLIIKPGNTCNFACRMCNPETSTSWYADAYQLSGTQLPFNEFTKKFETIRNSFDRSNEEFWQTLKEWIPNFEFVDIYGGEPFLSPGMFDVLSHGIDIGVAGKVGLRLHTNASLFNKRYVEILTQYKSVSFNCSIDSMTPKHFEYIRHRGNFESVVENTRQFVEIFKQHPNIKTNITLTVTPLNVFYVDQIKADLQNTFGLPVGINIVTTPEYDIRHLPIPVKTMLMRTIKTKEVSTFLTKTIPGCDVEWPNFCRVTDKLDQLRGQSFVKTFPDWWKILEPHWVRN